MSSTSGSSDLPDRALHRPSQPVTRPFARFGLSLETGSGNQAPAAGALSERATGLALIGGAAAVAALYVWDDLLLAAPIVATARLAGPLLAWAIFASIYGFASLAIALFVVAAYDRRAGSEPGRLARWVESQSEGRRGNFARRLIAGGKVLGFVASSFLLGGIVTTWLVRVIRPERAVFPTAVASCAIFGVTFAAQYAGIAALLP